MLGRWFHRGARGAVWYDPAYRWPFSHLEGRIAAEPRRADFVAWYLLEERVIAVADLRQPRPVSWADLARVHAPAWLEKLVTADALQQVFGLEGEPIPVDETVRTIRLAVGGTVEAARDALATRRQNVNLLGGFHHASPDRGAGLCPVNDVAVAVAVARAEGFAGSVAVIDLDAHQPDGTAACFAGDPQVWIGSISGGSWGELPGVDDVILRGATDAEYLAALDALLARMPRPDLAFVLAGGDVLDGDRLGKLALTPDGALERDRRVHGALGAAPAVWLPAGGYHAHSWRLLAATSTLVATGRPGRVRDGFEPLRARYGRVARSLPRELLGPDDEDDLGDLFPLAAPRSERKLLGFYTEAGVELALWRYGILSHLRRIGYDQLRTCIDDGGAGDRFRLFGTAADATGKRTEHLLIEAVYAREVIDGEECLYVHWMTLRDPRGSFEAGRPRLPGQEVPGLGLAPEATEMLVRMAERLGLSGVALRPAWYHVAVACRAEYRFADPARQGRFEALLRDLAGIPLVEATVLVAEGKVSYEGGEVYRWEAEPMVRWRVGRPADEEVVKATREAIRFTVSGA